AVGLALILAPLILLSMIYAREFARRSGTLTAICAVYVICLALTIQYGRYYIPILPLVVLLATVPVVMGQRTWLKYANLSLLAIVVCAQGASSALMYWNLPDRFPVKMAFGQESQESLLSRSLAEYPAASFLNRKIEPGQQVLAVGGDT